jgi:ABC-2 type transport system ATP-binding protein
VYTFDAQGEDTGVPELLRRLANRGVDYTDLQTRESSLEDIFVSLVEGRS